MIKLTLNGEPREIAASPDTPLLWALRDELGLPPLGTDNESGGDALPSYEDASALVEQAMDACERTLGP